MGSAILRDHLPPDNLLNNRFEMSALPFTAEHILAIRAMRTAEILLITMNISVITVKGA
jgi:hypothetical protein